MRRGILIFVCLLVGMLPGAALMAQDTDQMILAPAATSKFMNMPGIPKCLTIAVQRGDPPKGPAIMLLKMTAGCRVPWHWHSVGEQMMIVAGAGKAEMKDSDSPAIVKAGDFIYMPARHIHQLTATTALTLFNAPEGAFDIHYVDKNGAEITPEDALENRAK